MICEIDSDEKLYQAPILLRPREVLNHVKVILGEGKERHIVITHEGIVVDLIDGDEVVASKSITHDEFLQFVDENGDDWPV